MWNANTLALCCRESETFLNYNKVDFTLIFETHFINKNFLKIYGYTLYHISHTIGKAHVGFAIIVRNNVKLNLQNKIRKEQIQTTVIAIQPNKADLKVAAVYCQLYYCHNIKEDQFIEVFSKFGPRCINYIRK